MNLLLPVSRGPTFADAVRLAAETAKAHDGTVRVLAVVDRGEVRRIERGARPGAIHLARHAGGQLRGPGCRRRPGPRFRSGGRSTCSCWSW